MGSGRSLSGNLLGRGLAARSRLLAVLDEFVGRREAAGECCHSLAWSTASLGVA